MDLPSDVASTRCGELALRGKESRIIAYSLTNSSPTADF